MLGLVDVHVVRAPAGELSVGGYDELEKLDELVFWDVRYASEHCVDANLETTRVGEILGEQSVGLLKNSESR